ncbi:MAG: 2-amino-4-hydroxy-6-hydroxymethyldihydropteridine diphosphokinase [bacterium]|nr:2-amino-4-hydroxy-6-hydroxymethyldihydropteridine diphosphokinase [bacterium]
MDEETVLLALGSNIEPRLQHCASAMAILARHLRIVAASPVYETEPIGPPQARYLNVVLIARTTYAPRMLLAVLKRIECELGRHERTRNAPREMDIDILDYGQRVITDDGVIVPHPRLAQRSFVLVPLAACAPDWRHPVCGRTARELLDTRPPAERAGIRRFHRTLIIPRS